MLHWTYDHPDLPDALVRLDERTYHYFDVRGVTRVFDLKVDDAGRFHGTDGIDGTGESSLDANATYQRDFSLSYARASMGRPVA